MEKTVPDTESLAEIVGQSSWEAALVSCFIGTALFNAVSAQPAIDNEAFTKDLVGHLRKFSSGAESSTVREAIAVMANAVDDAYKSAQEKPDA